jgi:hypothetical protein
MTLDRIRHNVKSALPFLYFLVRRIKGFDDTLRFPEVPWVNERAKQWFDTHVSGDSAVFEYGSGSSTIYFARKARLVRSVEYKFEWYMRIRRRIREVGLENCTVSFIPPEKGADGSYMSGDPRLGDINFKTYAEKISFSPDASYDIVFIDGRARNACARSALPKVKDGGYIALDNSERPEYRPTLEYLASFKREDYSGPVPGLQGIHTTSVWKIKK